MRLLAAALRKLVRRPATFVTFGFLVGLLSLILIAVSATASQPGAGPEQRQGLLLVTFPGAYTAIVSFVVGLGGLFAVIYGAAIAGSEWTWGTLKSAVARGESRSRYQLLSFAAIAIMVGLGLLGSLAVGVAVAVIGANVAGVSTAGLGDPATLRTLPETLARGLFAMVEQGALGFAIATLARSQLAGIGAGIAFYFGEGFAGLFLPDVVKFMPFNAASAVVGSSGGFTTGDGGAIVTRLEPGLAVVVVAAWLIGSLAAATIFTERAEISG